MKEGYGKMDLSKDCNNDYVRGGRKMKNVSDRISVRGEEFCDSGW